MNDRCHRSNGDSHGAFRYSRRAWESCNCARIQPCAVVQMCRNLQDWLMISYRCWDQTSCVITGCLLPNGSCQLPR